LLIYRDKSFADRRNAASEAKKALLEKFKAKPAPDDPEVLAKQAERKAILDARERRDAEKARLKQEKLVREAEERAAREAAAEAARLAAEEAAQAEAKAREAAESERIARLLADEATLKAKRDARYAARKARKR
jgi:hypothetical protein